MRETNEKSCWLTPICTMKRNSSSDSPSYMGCSVVGNVDLDDAHQLIYWLTSLCYQLILMMLTLYEVHIWFEYICHKTGGIPKNPGRRRRSPSLACSAPSWPAPDASAPCWLGISRERPGARLARNSKATGDGRRPGHASIKAAGDSSLAAEPRDPSCPLLPGRARARSEGPPPPLPLQVPVVRERRDEREFWPDLRVEKR